MEEYIVDFQAFKDPENHFIVKEVAICSVYENVIMHFFVKPPYGLHNFSAKHLEQIDYITANVHGVSWYEGFIYFRDFVSTLRKMVGFASAIYVKGSERTKFIASLLSESQGKKVFDLDSFECPAANALPDLTCTHLCCPLPQHKNDERQFRCSLTHVQKFKEWLLKADLWGLNTSNISEILNQPMDLDEDDEEENLLFIDEGEDVCGIH